ncbi:hypothetical protein DERP_003095, partial [Dermatophagoides pteronyssinus]
MLKQETFFTISYHEQKKPRILDVFILLVVIRGNVHVIIMFLEICIAFNGIYEWLECELSILQCSMYVCMY